MDSTNVIAILLFIIPGVIAEKISNRMDIPNSKKVSDFKELVNGILFSLPIIIVVGYIINLQYGYKTIPEITANFTCLDFLIKFVVWTIIIAVISGMLSGIFKYKASDIINFIRVKIFKRISIDDKSCWRKAFLDDKTSRYLEVNVNGQTYQGFADCYSLPDEEKEIVLYIPDNWSCYPELKESIKEVKKTYINLEKNIVIKDYDISEHNKILDLIKGNQEAKA